MDGWISSHCHTSSAATISYIDTSISLLNFLSIFPAFPSPPPLSPPLPSLSSHPPSSLCLSFSSLLRHVVSWLIVGVGVVAAFHIILRISSILLLCVSRW